jgi:pimeloyl-ACP methyl ester carboxylesterase
VTTSTVEVVDGRQLAVSVFGELTRSPVFYLHGTPGSRIGPRPTNQQLEDANVCLITYDRPGYGRSSRFASRTVADVAKDVEAIADYLCVERFAVLGRSGGGPHALACAALLPDRVMRAATLVSLAPRQTRGLNWFEGMAESNVDAYTVAAEDPVELAALLKDAAARIYADPTSHVTRLNEEMPEADRQAVANKSVQAALALSFAEAVRDSAEGWIDDVLAFCSPWGFDLSSICVPVYLWHGGKDVFSPKAHTKWLADTIPGALAVYEPDRAHFEALKVVADVLPWLSGCTEKVMTSLTSMVATGRVESIPATQSSQILLKCDGEGSAIS